MEQEIPTTGNLKQYSLHQILTYLNKQQRRVILTIKAEKIKNSIYIEDSQVIFASTNRDEYRLGVLLMKANKITAEQRDESLELSKQTGRRQGIILVERGHITPKDLFVELKHQIKEIIFSLFLLEDGTFKFEENHSFSDLIKTKINIDSLIREGLIRKEEKTREKQSSYVQKINELCEKITKGSLSYYDVLEININASLPDIKKAYLKMAKHYHPDTNYDLPSPAIKEKLTALFTFINNAYQTLSDEAKRMEYNAILLKKKAKKTPGDKIIKAKEQFKRGETEFNKGNFWGAVDFLRFIFSILHFCRHVSL